MIALYGEQTRLTLENMSFSGVRLAEFPSYLTALAQVKKACAIANHRAGLLDDEKKEAICQACDELLQHDYSEQFPVDVFHGGGGIGTNMNMNEVIAGLAGHGVQSVDDVNMSQSTSDVCHTALRLCLSREAGSLVKVIGSLIRTAEEKSEAFHPHPTIARTCWQDGMSVPADAVLKGFADALSEQLELLEDYKDTLCKVNLGWTVIGSGTGASDGYRRHIMEALREVTEHPFSWKKSAYQAAQYTEDLSVLSVYIRIISSILAKFARDIRLLASGPETGLGEWRIPAVQAGSSFFPGKVNPVIAEMVIQCDMLIGGNDSVIQNVLAQGEVHLNVWEDMAGFLLVQNIMRLSKAADLFHRNCVSGLELNVETGVGYSRASIPLIVRYKEKYGYKKLAVQVKKYGFEETVLRIRKGELDQP
ncbi:lyase family protein [Blautia pseudococcoides]|uniref:lyase family protein n=1 Tax=Blautia pseudococcoides TaxID=1796616 RepID=UPI00148AF96A|nr:lyase family protein [Blautia pseudococcoides]QJU13438.1 aspartate ammonia-lyase [Blautia pseudococcoides]